MESTNSQSVELRDLIRYLVDKSGKSASRVSREIGRTSGYLGSVIHRGSLPSPSVLADIAEACGYCLALIGKDEAITVLPGESPGTDAKGDTVDSWMRTTTELERDGKQIVIAYGVLPEDVEGLPKDLADFLRDYGPWHEETFS